MSLLVVGSVALDSIFTPFGETADALGGSAVYFSVAGSLLHPVQVVGVVGGDYPVNELERLGGARHRLVRRRARRGRELSLEGQVQLRPAEPGDAGDPARRVRRFPAQDPREVPGGGVRLPRQHRSRAADRGAGAGAAAEARRVRYHELLDPGQEGGAARAARPGRRAHGQRRRGEGAERRLEHPSRRPVDPRTGPEPGGDQAGRIRRAAASSRREPSTCRPSPWRPCSIRPARATRSPAGSWRTWPAPASLDQDDIRRAMVYGAAMGSYAVEQFGIRGFERISLADVQHRVRAFQDLTHVPLAEPLP